MKLIIENWKKFLNEEDSYPRGEEDDIDKLSKVIIFNKSKDILILQRAEHMLWSSEKWDLPGGHWKEDETAKEAAKREVQEETGLDIESFEKIGNVENITVFRAKVADPGKIKLDDENSDHKWVDPKNINDYDFVSLLVDFVVDLEE